MFSAPSPTKVKFVESKKEREGSGAEDRSGVGLAYFNSVEVSGELGTLSFPKCVTFEIMYDFFAGGHRGFGDG